MDNTFKKEFASIFTRNYAPIVKDYIQVDCRVNPSSEKTKRNNLRFLLSFKDTYMTLCLNILKLFEKLIVLLKLNPPPTLLLSDTRINRHCDIWTDLGTIIIANNRKLKRRTTDKAVFFCLEAAF